MLVSMMGNFTYSNSMISTHHHTSLTNWVWSLFRTSHHHNNNHFPQKLLKRIDISNSQLSSSFPPPPKKKKSHSSRFQHFTRLFSHISDTFPCRHLSFFSPSRWVFSNRRPFPPLVTHPNTPHYSGQNHNSFDSESLMLQNSKKKIKKNIFIYRPWKNHLPSLVPFNMYKNSLTMFNHVILV